MEQGLFVKNLRKSYGNKSVIKDISFSINKGEAVALLGPNGAGKTTCFYSIIGIVKPDYGNILLEQKNITNLPIYKRARLGIGYLPQESSIFRGMSLGDNIMSVLEINIKSKLKRKERLEELLAEFSISHLRNVASIALSGGERRRLEIARALALNPSYILLDEPLAGIDPIAVNDVKELIIHLKKKGLGILITDHNVRDILSVIDRGYIVNDGVILSSGSPKEITQNMEVRRTYLGEGF